MNLRKALGIIVATTCLTLGVIAPTPASAEQSDAARLAELGIDTAKLAPGWELVGDKVYWQKEQVVLSLGPTARSDCPGGAVCMWEHANYGGQMVAGWSTGQWHLMSRHGFDNEMSSWYNNKVGHDARWYYNAWPENPRPSFCMNSGWHVSMDASNPNNDKMSMLYIYGPGNTC